jgi:hypothetical protein
VNILGLHAAHVVSPRAAGTSNDARELGAAVNSLGFVPLGNDPR